MKEYLILIILVPLMSCSSVNKKDFLRGYYKGYFDSCMSQAKKRIQQETCEDNYNKQKSGILIP